MKRVLRYWPVLASFLAACGTDEPAPASPDAGVDASTPVPEASAPIPTDAGAEAKAPFGFPKLAPTEQLGCPGNVRIEGDEIDTTLLGGPNGDPARTFVSFTDGTVGAMFSRIDMTAVRFDSRLTPLVEYPVGTLTIPRTGLSGGSVHSRTGMLTGYSLAGFPSSGPRNAFGAFFSFDFATDIATTFAYDGTIDGKVVTAGASTSDDVDSYAWAKVREDAEGESSSILRRSLRSGSRWQRTGLDSIPSAQWQENGETHFFLSGFERGTDAVVDDDGRVARTTEVLGLPRTTNPCSSSRVTRAGSTLVILRDVVNVDCTDPAYATSPHETWVHLPGDPVGVRLLDGIKRDSRGFALDTLRFGTNADAVMGNDVVDTDNFVATLQRLDANLRKVGNVVSVPRKGRPFVNSMALSPILGGYFWFVPYILDGGNNISSAAFRLVCAP